MRKPILSKWRVRFAFAVAGAADLGQIPISFMLSNGWTAWLGEFLDFAVDMLTAALETWLLGFHPVLLPAFLMKAAQTTALVPTWSASVTFVVWTRKKEAGENPDPPKAEPAQPKETAKTRINFSARWQALSRHGYFAAAIALVFAAIWFLHRPIHATSISPTIVSARSDDAEFSQTHERPVIAVGLITDDDGRLSKHELEKISATVEDELRQIPDVDVLNHPLPRNAPIDLLVNATILEAADSQTAYKGYNIETQALRTRCDVRVQVAQAHGGKVIYSKTFAGTATDEQFDGFKQTVSVDRKSRAIKSALGQLPHDPELLWALNLFISRYPTQTTTPPNPP